MSNTTEPNTIPFTEGSFEHALHVFAKAALEHASADPNVWHTISLDARREVNGSVSFCHVQIDKQSAP